MSDTPKTFMNLEDFGRIEYRIKADDCDHCHHIAWFAESGERVDRNQANFGICVGCGSRLPAPPVVIPLPPIQGPRPLAKSIARHMFKDKARQQFTVAKRKGVVKKKPCEVCGDTNSEAHHPDYSKPLEVVWLCRPHHRKADAERRRSLPVGSR